ncbi:MAG: lytic transglycosylase domain-containing protein [Bacteroidota bacterium]|nr:lytic transglycosylase domain-containing protein [Bacteroidota bacterium]
MKNIRSKSLLTLIIILFIIGFTTSAKNIISYPGGNFSDSTLDSASSVGSTLVKNPARVIYPLALREHREESKDYVKQFASKQRDYIIYMFGRGKNYFPKAAKILSEYDVPEEFQVLPALESNFHADAVSHAGAVGYWQFMSELGRDYGLHISSKNDDRKNFTKSTIAAAKFFRDQLHFFNDDILLSVAAFNCGTGGVKVAMKKSGIDNPDFWDIKKYLPTETRIFVMKFIALNVISANYHKFINHKLNFSEPPLIQLAVKDSLGSDNTVVAQNPL